MTCTRLVLSVLKVFPPLVPDPEEAIYDDVPRENSDSEPGLPLSGVNGRSHNLAAVPSGHTGTPVCYMHVLRALPCLTATVCCVHTHACLCHNPQSRVFALIAPKRQKEVKIWEV